IVERGGRKVLIGSAIAAILALVGATRLRTYGPTLEYMAKGGIPRTHLEKILEHFPGTTTMTVLYEGKPGDAKSVGLLENMDGLRAEIEKNEIVVKTNSLVDLVKMLHKTFAADSPVPYSLPHDQELVAQLLFLGDSPAFERFTDRTQSKALLVAYLSTDDSALVGPLVRDAQAWVAAHPAPDGVKVLVAGGSGPTVLAVNEHTTKSKMLNLLLVLATIWAVSSLMLRSPTGGLYVILPILATLLALFGLLGWTGVRLDMGSATTLAMAAGVGADYAIYFLYRLREERARASSDREALHTALRTSGRAVLFVAASIAAGFGVMGLSKFFGLRLFGSVMPAAMVISCLAALSIMPVLVMHARPRFVFGDTKA
ncbi:MAG: efflux RND transporter permease subunit, partial [Alphaproteobacteria bacterium]